MNSNPATRYRYSVRPMPAAFPHKEVLQLFVAITLRRDESPTMWRCFREIQIVRVAFHREHRLR